MLSAHTVSTSGSSHAPTNGTSAAAATTTGVSRGSHAAALQPTALAPGVPACHGDIGKGAREPLRDEGRSALGTSADLQHQARLSQAVETRPRNETETRNNNSSSNNTRRWNIPRTDDSHGVNSSRCVSVVCARAVGACSGHRGAPDVHTAGGADLLKRPDV